MHDDLDEPLRLPAAPPAPPRPGLPVAAAIVPVVGAVVLWQLTGSPTALWFAALGPLMAIASFADGLRSARRAKRRARREAAGALVDLGREVEERHAEERRRAWRRTPDVAGYADDPDEIWRVVPGRADVIVVGRGAARSALRVDGDAQEADARAVRRRARTAGDMPVHVPLEAGIAVSGPPVLAAAVVRALVVQLCLAQAPGQVRLVGDAPALAGDGAGGAALPHAAATRGAVVFAGSGERPVPADADIPIVQVAEGAPPPPRCAAVLTLEVAAGGAGAGDPHAGAADAGDESAIGGGAGVMLARLDHDGTSRRVRVEAISQAQAGRVAAVLAERAATLGQRGDAAVAWEDLPAAGSGAGGVGVDGGGGSGSLAAVVGVSGGEPVTLDLVADGPHAVVIGVTGSGKSELLTTWILAMCRSRSPREVSFLLVDFKGGRTFDALVALPHVTGVLTDLDEDRALRAVESLRAEIRHRERVLEESGARDIAEAAGALSRLVIVVDEYAALVAVHPGLHDLFADIAARGRALGMHLVLASQRAAGAFRDGVLANAPLRIAFRVTDAADSRAVLGQDDAVRLPGTPSARGTALVRAAADAGPRTVRIARAGEQAVARVVRDGATLTPARRPWMPPLPDRVEPADAHRIAGSAPRAGEVVLGLADEPEHQRQRVVVLPEDAAGVAVVGGPGSGRTTLLRAIAAQATAPVWVPADAEGAWDAVAGLSSATRGAVVLVDDVDAIAGRLGDDHAGAWLAALERGCREARARGITLVIATARASGPAWRLLELLPHRALLPLANRADHVAAGGESADFAAGAASATPGRGRWGRTLVQFSAVPGGAAMSGAAGRLDRAPLLSLSGIHPLALVAPPGADLGALRAAAERAGRRVVGVGEAGASTIGAGDVVVGTPDGWIAQWRLLSEAREHCTLVIDAACAPEYRAVTGRRELPPYASPGARRAWEIAPGAPARRVTLPG